MRMVQAPTGQEAAEMREKVYLADVRVALAKEFIRVEQLFMTVDQNANGQDVKYVHAVVDGVEYKHYFHPRNDVDHKNVAYFVKCMVVAARKKKAAVA